jgi:hypothetical protein
MPGRGSLLAKTGDTQTKARFRASLVVGRDKIVPRPRFSLAMVGFKCVSTPPGEQLSSKMKIVIMTRQRRLGFLLLAAFSAVATPETSSLRQVLARSGSLNSQSIRLSALDPAKAYTLLFSIDSPASLQPESRIATTLSDGSAVLAEKTLHLGDSDFYAPFQVAQSVVPELRITAASISGARFPLQVNEWPNSDSLNRGGNHHWQDANAMKLGLTVFASADDVNYIPVSGTPRRDAIESAAGEDWYKFYFDGAPKLVFFQIELMDRDDLPVDVSIFSEDSGKLEDFTNGQDPVALPHQVQALPGNIFAPRVLSATSDVVGSTQLVHGGGVCGSKGSIEYETMLQWVKGAKLDTARER